MSRRWTAADEPARALSRSQLRADRLAGGHRPDQDLVEPGTDRYAWGPPWGSGKGAGMQDGSVVRDLLDRWTQVWHEGRYDLALDCVAPVYTRHETAGTREVTPEEYVAELAAARERLPNVRFGIHDYAITGDRARFRFTMRWTDAATGQPRSQAGMQIYRIENGKLAETWITSHGEGSAWPDDGRPWSSAEFPRTPGE